MQTTQAHLQQFWLKALLFVLAGYALFGRGFAYLFLGEAVLALGIVFLIRSQRVLVGFTDSVLLLWTLFALWGFCRTIPFLGEYHFDAIRDAVLWGYGFFAVLVYAFVRDPGQLGQVLKSYRRFLRWYLPVLPAIVVLSVALGEHSPLLPWNSGVRVFGGRGGDFGVHLAGAALFLLLFPAPNQTKQSLSIRRMLSFAGWLLSGLVLALESRGGAMAMLVPVALVSFLRPKKFGLKVALLAGAAVASALLLLELNPFALHVKGHEVSAESIGKVMGSIVGGDAAPGHEGTKAWRLAWWNKIVHYTIFGDYFWTGKGFGVNLAAQDLPSASEDIALRSPHNGHMTVLARTGVPGISIWILLQLTFGWRMVAGYRRANRNGQAFWANMNLWIFGYWLSALINMSFDIYVEGPQGGILFWSLIGFGLVCLRLQAVELRQRIADTRTVRYPAVDSIRPVPVFVR